MRTLEITEQRSMKQKSLGDTISIIMPDNFHTHLRRGDLMLRVISHTARHFRRALPMPNTKHCLFPDEPDPILTGIDARKYQEEILSATAEEFPLFEPLMTIQITESTTPLVIWNAKIRGGVIAGKYYPKGVTTNSENGVADIRRLSRVFRAMERAEMVLPIHGECPYKDTPVMKKEKTFVTETLPWLVKSFPKLKIVLEHVSTRDAIEYVRRAPANVAATIAIPHLFIIHDDILGDKLRPHRYCRPVPQEREDRQAIREVVISGNPKFFLGTDSAPHMRSKKECAEGEAGVFSDAFAVQLCAQLFEEMGHMDKLEGFMSRFGAMHYGLPLNKERITLVKKPWIVPMEYDDIVPFMAGKEIAWQVVHS